MEKLTARAKIRLRPSTYDMRRAVIGVLCVGLDKRDRSSRNIVTDLVSHI